MPTQEELKNMSPEEMLAYQKQQCIFCSIISGKVPAKKVYEDEQFIAILDIRPANAGHVLLLPKEHYNMMPQIPPEVINKLALVSKGLSNAMLKGLGASGSTIFAANGMPAGQRASHFMLHVIPRFDGDNLNIELPQRSITDNDMSMLQERLIPFVNKTFGVNMQVGKAKEQAPESKQEKKTQSEDESEEAKETDENDELLDALSGKEKEESEDKEDKNKDKEESDEDNKPKGGAGADLDAIAGLLG